jgi:hypothetical protein
MEVRKCERGHATGMPLRGIGIAQEGTECRVFMGQLSRFLVRVESMWDKWGNVALLLPNFVAHYPVFVDGISLDELSIRPCLQRRRFIHAGPDRRVQRQAGALRAAGAGDAGGATAQRRGRVQRVVEPHRAGDGSPRSDQRAGRASGGSRRSRATGMRWS